MIPAQAEDGQAFAGNAWKDDIVLPTHRTNDDGTQGSTIDWTGSSFTVDTTGLPVGVTLTLTPNMQATPPIVTLSLAEADTAAYTVIDSTTSSLPLPIFRYYLREDVVYGGDVFLWRLIRVGAET